MSTEPYTLDPVFESQLVAALVTDRRTFGALRTGLDPTAFPTPAARTLVEMCMLVFKDTGEGPGSDSVVAQKLRHQQTESGKITVDSAVGAADYLESALKRANRPPPDTIVHSFLPQLRDRLHGEVLRDALMGLDPVEMRRRLEVAATLGFVDTSLGSKLGPSSFKDIAGLALLEKIPTGMPQLDSFLGGGAPRGQLWCWLGGTNSGKSTALGQQAAAALREGALVLYGTNELPVSMVKAKILADLTDTPYAAIMSGHYEKCAARYAELAPTLGDVYVKELDSGLTTPADIEDWCKEVEESEGRPVGLICVDYADRMSDGKPQNSSDYVVMRNVYNGLVQIAKDRDIVVATASQAKAMSKGQRFLKTDDMADSRHKGRIANVVVSLNWDIDKKEMWLYVCKQKLGVSDHPIGPIPTDWMYGRVSTISNRVKAGAKPSDDWQAAEVNNAFNEALDKTPLRRSP